MGLVLGSRAVLKRDLDRALILMKAEDDRLIKNGIQAACELMEKFGRQLSRGQVDSIRVALSAHLGNINPHVRRWIYKLIALLGDPPYTPYLREQLRSRDLVNENRSWAVAALAVVSGDYRPQLQLIDDDHTLTYALSSAMFSRQPRLEEAVRRASCSDDRLAHQWLGLLYGDGRAPIPVQLVTELTLSPYPEVAEYAIWGLRKRRMGSISDVAFDPEEVRKFEPNVRRWYYRLLLKDSGSLSRYSHQLRSWIELETDSKAREGLAMGFYGATLNAEWVELLRSWAQVEKDPYVMDALLRRPDIARTDRLGRDHRILPTSKAPTPLPPDEAERFDPREPVARVSRLSRGRVYKITVYEGGTVFVGDNRDQSVNVANAGSIESVQGAGSSLSRVSNDAVLIDVLAKLALAVREDARRSPHETELRKAADDLEQVLVDDPNEKGWIERAREKLGILGSLLAGTAIATQHTDELLKHAEDILHRLS